MFPAVYPPVSHVDLPPVEVHGFAGAGGHARAGSGACGLQFQFYDPRRDAYVDYFLASGAAADPDGLVRPDHVDTFSDFFLVPPHDRGLWEMNFDVYLGPPMFPANASTLLAGSPWRVVDADNEVITTFVGPYAENARELQRRLGDGRHYQSDRRAAGCRPTAEHECWTALEIWVQLESWKDLHCGEPG